MKQLILNDKILDLHLYKSEEEFEKKIVSESDKIFGSTTIYLDIKKRIGKSILSIPDGYLIDYSFPNSPSLFLIENELSNHDTFRHIAPQLLRFAQSFNQFRFELKNIIKDSINRIESHKIKIDELIKTSSFLNIDEILDFILHPSKLPAVIVVIDNASEELSESLDLINLNTNIITFKTFKDSKNEIHLFEPFNEEIRDLKLIKKKDVNVEELDTIVVPSHKEGMERAFLGANCWYAIKLSSNMIDRIKYIAAYQTSPVSSITHVAEVSHIEKYTPKKRHISDSWDYSNQINKYILYFKQKAIKLKKKIPKESAFPPQSPRYCSYKKLIKAKNLKEVFN